MQTPAAATVQKPSATMTQSLVRQVYDRLFGDHTYQFDLVEGTVMSAADIRIIYLSSDIIRGIYEALHFEAGEAWKLILKSCGYIWGKRVAATLEKELKTLVSRNLDRLTTEEYIDLLENYFAMHGWGKLKFYLDDAPRYGIVRASMTHSLFVTSLNQLNENVDHMIAGMLRGMFENISGHTLDCTEVICARRNAAPSCEFLISAPERIQSIEMLADEGAALDTIIDHLRQC